MIKLYILLKKKARFETLLIICNSKLKRGGGYTGLKLTCNGGYMYMYCLHIYYRDQIITPHGVSQSLLIMQT